MSTYASAAHSGATKSPVSVPFVVAAALLMGLGVLLVILWLVYFNWAYFAGVLPAVVGMLMLFDRRAGADRA